MQFDLSQIQSHERIIHQLHQQLNNLHNTNNQLQSQIQNLNKQKNYLVLQNQNDPIYKILHGLDDPATCTCIHSDNNTLIQDNRAHQQTVLRLQQEVIELKNILGSKDHQILQLNRQLEAMRRNQSLLLNKNRYVALENESIKKHQDQLTKIMKNNEQKWQKFANQINQAKRQFFEATQKNHQELSSCTQNIQSLRNAWLNAVEFLNNEQNWKKHQESKKIEQMTKQFKRQSQIMEELGRELDLRNEQIQLIRTTYNKNSEGNTFDEYQHSLNQMLRQYKQRERNYTDLLKKYQQLCQNFKESLREKQNIQSQYIKLKQLYETTKPLENQNRSLKRQLQSIKQNLHNLTQQNNFLLTQSQELLTENDAFLSFMRDIHGSQVFQQRINQEVAKYEQRKQFRNQNQIWANTRELLQMNLKLRRKIYGQP